MVVTIKQFFDNLIIGIFRPCLKGMNMDNKPYIANGRIYNVSISEYFNVRLSSDDNPSINPTINLNDMPLKVMAKLCHEALKVRGRPAMKKMDVKALEATYKGEISWRVLFSKVGAETYQSQITMSNSEIDAEISRLKALQSRFEPKDDFDQAVEDIEGLKMDTEKNNALSEEIDAAVDDLIDQTSNTKDDNQ